MVLRKVLAFILLCLFLLINWHNAILHSHHESTEGGFAIGHPHEHPVGHRSEPHEHTFWAWFKQLVGDFEHPDLGEDHFELFLKPGRQITLDQSSTFLDSPFTLFQITLERADFVLQRKVVKPQKVPSFTDPPVHSASGSRGPPLFS